MPLNRQANAAISNGNHSPAAEKAGSSLPADKKLFTPGPLGVSLTTKQAMLRDLGSRDVEFVNKVSFIRQRLLEVAGVPASTHTCVPVQGSGTFAVEAVITTTVPRESGKVKEDRYIITSYHFPDHPAFSFKDFYSRLNDKGQVIYPGKVTKADCFRVGNIGHLFPEDMQHLLHCIQEVCADMGIPLPLKTSS
ncbi:PREDICTED: uncharacterized protein LOC109470929 [Branchiostoma belcheri]|uniref:Uncharacterized protein LOC109470929 n=1 Tax=Branchiostoma belcheri TaxID=7741 RepID=A0A6P4Y983_BRABE|nr:PREDICTED: uncharacterized protein LOC109470929 [Branchiostoma belcheri]